MKGAVPFAAIVSAWHAFAFGYFGIFIPQSVKGKIGSHGALERIDWEYAAGFLSYHLPLRFLGQLKWLGWLMVISVAIFGAIAVWRHFPKLRALVLYWTLMTSLLFAAKAPFFSWYFPPVLWVFWLLSCYACYQLVNVVFPVASRRLALIAAAALVCCAAIGYGSRDAKTLYDKTRQRSPWLQVADFALANTTPGSRVYFEHIGLFGRRVDRIIIDPIGLISPAALDARQNAPDRYVAKVLQQENPELVVLYPDMLQQIQGNTADAQWFAATYEPAKVIPIIPSCHTFLLRSRSENTRLQPSM
jgi:hypothetical protein